MLSLSGLMLLAPAATASPATTARANTDILVSTDGTHFAPTVGGGLFGHSGPIVPGQEHSADLWVKNITARTAVLALNATNVSVSSAVLARALTVRADADTSSSSHTVVLADAAECTPLLTGVALGAHASIRLPVTLAMSADITGTEAQNSSANFTVVVSLRDAAEPALSGSGCADGTDVHAFGGSASDSPSHTAGPLADTGLNITAPLVGGGMFTMVGIVVILVARRFGRRSRKIEAL